MSFFNKLYFLLAPSERKRAAILLLMIIIASLIETIGIASILPFMMVITNSSIIETNYVLSNLFNFFVVQGIENKQQFIILLGAIVLILFLFSLIIKAFTSYLQIQFVSIQEHMFGKRLVESYLRQPYSWILNRHSANLVKNIFSEINLIIGNGITPFVELIAKGISTIVIIILLILSDPKLTLIIALTFSCSYGIIFYFVKYYLNQAGEKRLKHNFLRFKLITEAFKFLKEIKIGKLEKIFINKFSESSKIYADTQITTAIIAQLPRYFLEAICFGGIMIILLYSIVQEGNIINGLPIISLYVFAGYRLLPAIQQIFTSSTQIIFVGPTLDRIYEDLKNFGLSEYIPSENLNHLLFEEAISLKNIYYNYPNSSNLILKNITLRIPAKSTVGLVGATGSGKTTLTDIIIGLLEPQKGIIEIDKKILIKENLRSWQRSIGFVPQQIYLSDDTIESNIAFGVDHKNIDRSLVEQVSKIASLHNFIIDELPDKYQTTIGENGVRLSGGQRQRIGIARALYSKPQLLILDEATSALDNETEKLVIDSINNLSKNITIILISHHLNTLKNCDIIYELKKGELVKTETINKC